MALISSHFPAPPQLLTTKSHSVKKRNNDNGDQDTHKRIKTVPVSNRSLETHRLKILNDILRYTIQKYIGWGNKDSLNAMLVCRQFKSIVDSHPMHALVSTIIKLKTRNLEPEHFKSTEIELPPLGSITNEDFKRVEKALDYWDPGDIGFRRLLLHNLNLTNRKPWKEVIERLWKTKKLFAAATETYTSDVEIKRIAANANKAIVLMQSNPLEWKKEAIDEIAWQDLPPMAANFQFDGQLMINFILNEMVIQKIPQISKSFGNKHFVLALFGFAKDNLILTNALSNLVSEEDKKDLEYLYKIVSVNGLALDKMPDPLKLNKEFVMAAIKQNRAAYAMADPQLKQDKAFALEVVKLKGLALEFVHPDLQKDREVVLEAVKQNGMALEYAHTDLQDDAEIVMAAINQIGSAIIFASADKKRDRNIAFASVNQNGRYLGNVLYQYRKIRNFVLTAVRKYGLALESAPPKYRRDKVIVLEAVKQNGLALEFAAEELQDDEDVVEAAVAQNGLALKFASTRLRGHKTEEPGNRKIVARAVNQNGRALEFTSKRYKMDESITLDAVTQRGIALEHTYFRNKGEFSIVLAAVRNNGLALEFASPVMKRNREIVVAAIMQNGRALKYAHATLQKDLDLIALANRQIALS